MVTRNRPAMADGWWSFGVRAVSVSLAPDDDGIGSAGEYGWGGAAATVYWADPAEEFGKRLWDASARAYFGPFDPYHFRRFL